MNTAQQNIMILITTYLILAPTLTVTIVGFFPTQSPNLQSCYDDMTLQRRIALLFGLMGILYLPCILKIIGSRIPIKKNRYDLILPMTIGLSSTLAATGMELNYAQHFDDYDYFGLCAWSVVAFILTSTSLFYLLQSMALMSQIKKNNRRIKKRGDLVRPILPMTTHSFPDVDFYDVVSETCEVTRESVELCYTLCLAVLSRDNNVMNLSSKVTSNKPKTILEVRDLDCVRATYQDVDVKITSPHGFKAVKIQDVNYYKFWIILENGGHYDRFKALLQLNADH